MELDNYATVNKALGALKRGATELPETVKDENQEATKETLKQMATGINTALGTHPVSEAARAEPLSNEWEVQTDPTSGQQYYYNTQTGESKRKEPITPAKVVPPPPPPSSATPTENLPPGWVEKIDENSGFTYYVNTSTQESTWDRPVSGGNKKRHRGKSKRRYKRGRGKYSRRRHR